MRSPSVEGIVSSHALEETGATIAALQLPDGMIEWFPGGHADPWNHVESAMALSTIGMVTEARPLLSVVALRCCEPMANLIGWSARNPTVSVRRAEKVTCVP